MGITVKRLLDAFLGKTTWPPPIWLMRQAGRYLPEYRELRSQTTDFVSFCLDPTRASTATLQPIRRFGMDGAILFSDILILPWAMGRDLRFDEGHGPRLPPLRTVDEMRNLQVQGFLEKVEPVLETIRLTRSRLAADHPETALIGFVGAPFTVACYMVEGGGSKDFAETRKMAATDPDLFDALIERITEASIAYLLAQIAAGAEAVMLFDSWAGLLSPSGFEKHVIQPTARIVAGIRQHHPTIPIIGFPRLAGTMVAAYAEKTGVNTVGVDTAADLNLVRQLVPQTVGLQGNLDPFALLSGGQVMEQEARAILDAMKGRPFVFNLGHGVMPPTPPDHVAALVDFIRGQ
ncbi:uroporphyrinogen decarboxylase [Acidisoma cellulosilytica]|uniref:Uroporphyrinogen decarboxylase n=1 Tax=Acidisoma cellulosilyticum TaxID=2802395 RepID=A0A964E400_9PROT|nr:uroporphyrinogen decarboxylase [Acidisoma cellulosilyticum]MCB8880964.1 uroporphyrinogen decarboxylase [Acidisoma cellulosilyticum]